MALSFDPSELALNQPQVSFDPVQKGVPDAAVDTRAAKYDFAMGDQSPGVDAISADLRSTGGEYVRQQQASINELKFEQAKLDAVYKMVQSQPEGQPFPDNEVQFIMGMDKQTAADVGNSNSIMETEYAKRYMREIATRDEAQSFDKVGAVAPEAANIALDAGEHAITQNEVAHKILDQIETDQKAQSWPGAIGDFLGVVMPMSAVRLENLVKQAPTTTVLPGQNVLEQISYLRTLPPDKFEAQLQAAVDSMPNLELRNQFVSAVIQTSDAGVFLTNAQTLLDAVDVGTMAKVGAKGAYKLLSRGAGKQLGSLVTGGVNASKARGIVTGQVAAQAGNFQTAAVIKGVQHILGSPIHDAQKIADAAVSITNPSKLLTNSLPHLSREAEQRVAESLDTGAATVVRILEQDTVARTSVERAALIADETASRVFSDHLRSIQSAILDIDSSGTPVAKIAISKARSLYPPRGVIKAKTFNPPTILSPNKYTVEPSLVTNTEVLNIAIGQKNGMLFSNDIAALKFAQTEIPDLKIGLEDIRSFGSGYYINVPVDLPDRLDNFAHLSILTDRHAESVASAVIGRVTSTQSLLSGSNQVARKQVTHGAVKMFEELQGLLEPLMTLHKDKAQWAELEKVWNVEKNTIGPNGRGKTFGSIGEFQQAYFDQNGHWPSELATTAYYRQMQLEDLELIAGNGRMASDDIRLGVHQWNDTYATPNVKGIKSVSSSFKGKEIDTIPWNDGHTAAIAVKDPVTNVIKIYQKNTFTSKKIKTLIDDIKTKGGRIVQVTQDDFTIPGVSTNQYIRFYVSSSPKRERVSLYQFDRAGHRIFDNSEAYIKQGRILLDKSGKRGYHVGDTSILGSPSIRLAKEVSKHMEIARQMMNRNDPALDMYVSANVGGGFDGKAFQLLFKDQRNAQGKLVPGLDKNVPISWSKKGGRTSDNIKYNDHYAPQGIAIADETRSPYNLKGEHIRDFAIERGDANLKSIVEEKGVRRILKDGNTLNIGEATIRSAKRLVDIRLKRDYVLKSANDFIEQFGEYMKTGKAELTKDPLHYLYNPEWADRLDPRTKRSAMNAQNAIIRFMSNLNPDDSPIQAFKSSLMDRGGVQGFIANWLLPTVAATPRALRTAATHLTMGFNPVQLLVQGQTAAAVMAISPRHGLSAASIYMPLRLALMNPKWYEHSRGVVGKLGWKADEFDEMFQGLKNSGWNMVKGDMAILDQVENPRLIQTARGKMADISLFFMTEGERTNRLVSYAAAYSEWKAGNTNKALDRNGRAWVLNRADNMTQNMSSASNAVWQKGPLAVPAQFYTYQARLTEQYLTSLAGKGNLTRAEAYRLMAVQSVMYGIPTAAAGVLGGWPIYESIKSFLIEHQVPHDNPAVEALLSGIPQAMTNYLTGIDSETGSRFGAGGLTILRDAWTGDKSLTELALGVGGGKVGEFISNTYPFIRGAWDAVTTDPSNRTYPMDEETIVRVFNSMTVANNAYKMIYALNTGKWLSKYGRSLDNISNSEAIYSALMGSTPTRISEMYTTRALSKAMRDGADAATLQVIDLYKRAMKSDLGFDDRADYMRQAKAFAVMGGLTDQQIMQAMRSAMDQVAEDQVDTVKRNWERDQLERNPDRFNQGGQ